MKIALIMGSVSRLAGGLLEANRRLAQGWHARGDEVLVVGIKDEFTEKDLELWSPLTPVAFTGRGPSRFGYAPGLEKTVMAFAPDVVHSQGLWTYTSWVAARWRRHSGRGEIVHPHGMLDAWALRNSAWKKRLMAAFFERRHLRRANCIRALCHAELESIRAYGYRGPVCVVPNGMDLPNPSSEIGIHPMLPKGKKVLLYLGRLHPKKGLTNLIKAWGRVKNRPGWILAMAGWDEGGHEESLRQLAQVESLQEDVLFLGPQFGPDKERLYRACNVFVLPSFSEGLPMVILEAWAHGKPVLMTPMCNLPEGITTGAAVSIEANVDSLRLALEEILGWPDEKRGSMGQSGRRLVQEQFSWQRVVEELSSVNDWLVQGKPVPACVDMG